MKPIALLALVLLLGAMVYDRHPTTQARRLDQRILDLQADIRELDAKQQTAAFPPPVEPIPYREHRQELTVMLARLQAQRQALK